VQWRVTEGRVNNEQIIVLGAGIGGLLAAGAVAPFFERVVVIEKDLLPDELRPRKGVPQGPQVHAIIKRGENAITGIFPNFPDRLAAAGGAIVDVGRGLHVFEGGGWHPRRDVGLTMFTQTRALLEQVIRDCLTRLGNVTLKTDCRFAGLDFSDQGAVSAVRIKAEGSKEDSVIPADLVVDAMGRGSPLPMWLENHGYGSLRQSRTGIDVHYVTLHLQRPEAYKDAPNGWIIRPTGPTHKRGATMIAIEGQRWLLTLVGRLGDTPPLDVEGCLEYAKTVEGGVLYDLIRDAEILMQPRRFKIPEALLKHFDEMESLPTGLLPLGDVIGTFNPLFAQGMTIAALHAEILRDCLNDRPDSGDGWASLSRHYITEALAVSKAAWQGAANADFVYPETEGQRPPDLAEQQKIRHAVRELMETDALLHRDAIHVQQMLLPSEILARPEVLKKAGIPS